MSSSERPSNIEAENIVLGSMLTSEDACISLINLLKPEDFVSEANSLIFKSMVNLYSSNKDINRLSLKNHLEKEDKFELIGGNAYLAQLISETTSTVNAEEYAKVVLEKSGLRSLIIASEKILNEAREGKRDIADILDFAERELFGILQKNKKDNEYVFLFDVFKRNLEEIEALRTNSADLLNLNTGFSALDNVLNGIGITDLVVIAARPGVGKTSFALSLAKNISEEYDKKTLIFNLEMTDVQLGKKFLSMGAEVPLENIKTGKLDDDEMERLIKYQDSGIAKNIAIDHNTNPTIMDIKSQCRKMKAKQGLDMIIVDYVQIMSSNSNHDNRNQEIAELTRSFKLLGREMNCPVILLSQLSRNIEARAGANKLPRLSDLKDSGAIEQDADIVMFISKDDNSSSDDPMADENRNVREIVVAKNRNGSIGNVKLKWLGKYTAFKNLAQVYQEGM